VSDSPSNWLIPPVNAMSPSTKGVATRSLCETETIAKTWSWRGRHMVQVHLVPPGRGHCDDCLSCALALRPSRPSRRPSSRAPGPASIGGPDLLDPVSKSALPSVQGSRSATAAGRARDGQGPARTNPPGTRQRPGGPRAGHGDPEVAMSPRSACIHRLGIPVRRWSALARPERALTPE